MLLEPLRQPDQSLAAPIARCLCARSALAAHDAVLIDLGCVDGFDKHNRACEAGECGERGLCFIAAQGDALEAFEFPHCLLDSRAQCVEPLGEVAVSLLGIRLAWDDRDNPARPSCRPIGVAVISFVGDRHTRRDVRTEIERGLELRGVAHLAAGQVEIERIAIEVGLEVDFRREAAA